MNSLNQKIVALGMVAVGCWCAQANAMPVISCHSEKIPFNASSTTAYSERSLLREAARLIEIGHQEFNPELLLARYELGATDDRGGEISFARIVPSATSAYFLDVEDPASAYNGFATFLC